MLLLSEYVKIIRKTHNVETESELKTAILSSLPLMYPGLQNMITRSAKYYGSELTRKVEDENIKVLFDVLGVEPRANTVELILGNRSSASNQANGGDANQGEGEDRQQNQENGMGRRIMRFLRENVVRIAIGAVFTGFLIYIGNLNMLWMILIAFLFRL